MCSRLNALHGCLRRERPNLRDAGISACVIHLQRPVAR
ncbi:hypothetical protein Salmuc_03201 [Salipiger mucosus DSM 16094]|uniref:Uncharacterized protein n=1 Tax=Salipiger mucosus DSM 16094 TaxID=1123237 RepID=S9Q6K2_9RHOB|nr:hypothetical protein Salmuc_03201 [Salipiger mucosus DSM 16094]